MQRCLSAAVSIVKQKDALWAITQPIVAGNIRRNHVDGHRHLLIFCWVHIDSKILTVSVRPGNDGCSPEAK